MTLLCLKYQQNLDSLVEDEVLGQWFPNFQTTSKIDARGIGRLHKSLDGNIVVIDNFRQIGYYGHRHEAINDDDLAALIQKILTKDGGLIVAVEILKMRFDKSQDRPMNYSKSLVATARSVLANFPYHEGRNKNIQRDYSFSLAQIANVCLRGEDGVELTKKICQALAKGLQKLSTSVFDYQHLLQSLAGVQPYIFLDAFIGSNAMESGVSTSRDHPERDDNPVNQIPNSTLISWCEQNPEIRYPQLVSSVQTYIETKEEGDVQWKPITYSILEKSPDLQAILSILATKIHPMSWAGSLADVMEKRSTLFTSLYDHPASEVRSWARKKHEQLKISIQKRREDEHRRNKQRFERFE
jgi:hypothetical protein